MAITDRVMVITGRATAITDTVRAITGRLIRLIMVMAPAMRTTAGHIGGIVIGTAIIGKTKRPGTRFRAFCFLRTIRK